MTADLIPLIGRNAALVLAFLAIIMNADAASEKVLFDFQASKNPPTWQIVNDDVMGGVSTSKFQVLTNGGAIFSGVVSLENNGGFASVRSSAVRSWNWLVDTPPITSSFTTCHAVELVAAWKSKSIISEAASAFMVMARHAHTSAARWRREAVPASKRFPPPAAIVEEFIAQRFSYSFRKPMNSRR